MKHLIHWRSYHALRIARSDSRWFTWWIECPIIYHSVSWWSMSYRWSRSGGLGRVQCQICYKTEHEASVCYHRHSSPMPPTMSNQWSYSPQTQWPHAAPAQSHWTRPNPNTWQRPNAPGSNQWPTASAQPPSYSKQWLSPAAREPSPGFPSKPSTQPQA